MYVRGYLQGSENGRVVTIGPVGIFKCGSRKEKECNDIIGSAKGSQISEKY